MSLYICVNVCLHVYTPVEMSVCMYFTHVCARSYVYERPSSETNSSLSIIQL